MKVYSPFDGISIAQQALKELNIPVEKYYASEIDKYAISITQKNFPNTIQLGSVTDVKGEELNDIDLIIGGSPCQDLSIAKKNREGLKGSRSALFYDFVRLVKEVKPKYFILENVNSMPKEATQIITEELWGIEPVMINAALVSAQNRKRLFWTCSRSDLCYRGIIPLTYEQIKIEQPEDKGILLKDILESEVNEKYYVENYNPKWNSDKPIDEKKDKYKVLRVGGDNPTVRVGSLNYSMVLEQSRIRKLTPIECERLQSLPDNYTAKGITEKGEVDISNTQRYKALGNGFNCEVIKHILNHIIKEIER
jgi:DNA-cytosine methyltransferase